MRLFSKVTRGATNVAGSARAVLVLAVVIGAWLVWGVLTAFGRPWELAMTAGAPLLTLLMLVVLQHAENRDSRATHLKLNELLLALEQPDRDVVNAEHAPDATIDRLSDRYRKRASHG